MYIVKEDFVDLKDNNHLYRVGDKYPHAGRVDPDRAQELAGNNNKLGRALIEEKKRVRKNAD